jgi:hypothetical protein
MEAILLADQSISVSWEPVANATAYRIYSDMGTGYGVYVYKAQTAQDTYTEGGLRASTHYRYRVAAITSAGEKVIARAGVTTPADSGLRATSFSSTVDPAKAAAPAAVPSTSLVRVTPAPTPLPPDTVILGLLSASDYANDVEDSLVIVGEVRNDSHLDIGQASVAVTFYGVDGQVIDEVSGPPVLNALSPGIRSPFVITLPQPSRWENYSLRATGRPVNFTGGTGLNVINTRRFEDTAGFYHVAGVIENASDRRVEQARVVVTLYDRGGRVVNVGFAYPQPSSLPPHDRADFDVAFTYYPKVFSHLAIALGE